MLQSSTWLEDDHPKSGKRSQRPLDALSNRVPRKTAETGAERRNGDRMETKASNFHNECSETCVDVLQP